MRIGNVTITDNDMILLFEVTDGNDFFQSDAYSPSERDRVYEILDALKAEVKKGSK